MTLSCLPCAFCFVPAHAKFAHEFLTLFHRPCANYLLAFLADFTLSDSTAPICFVVKLFSLANYTLLFVWIKRQAMITAFTCFPSYRYSSFTVQAYLCWRHTANGHLANSQRASFPEQNSLVHRHPNVTNSLVHRRPNVTNSLVHRHPNVTNSLVHRCPMLPTP